MRNTSKKRKSLEAAGYWVGEASDWLGLSEDERRVGELHVQVARAVRRLRLARGMTQKELATILKISQPRIVDIEASVGASLDQTFRAFFALGGELSALGELGKPLREAEQAAVVEKPKARTASRSSSNGRASGARRRKVMKRRKS